MKLIRNSLAIEQRVQVMGVLNVTPDSFSDGGRFVSVERAIQRALEIEAQGADLLDIGGESTRPGSKPVTVEEELDRVLPVIDGLKGNLRIPISIDTTKHEVAAEAIAHGAELINDISGLRFDAELADVAAETGAALALMHSRGTPETMQKLPPVDDIFDEVIRMLSASIDDAVKRGVRRDKLIIDPGIGFGKTPEQNLQLIQGLDRLSGEFDLPALLGPSRKSFIPKTLDLYLAGFQRDDERERLAGTAAAVALGIERGARLIRVHDVIEMVAVVRLTEALMAV